MTIDTLTKTTVTLSEHDLKSIIREYLEVGHGFSIIGGINITVGSKPDNEGDYDYFINPIIVEIKTVNN